MTQSVMCLLSKHENLSSIFSTHAEKARHGGLQLYAQRWGDGDKALLLGSLAKLASFRFSEILSQ